MTSKLSFAKLYKENLRRNPALVLTTVFLCLMELLGFILQFQNVYELYRTEDPSALAEEIGYLTDPGLIVLLTALFLGVLLAMGSLRFLHSKRQTDFYASLPVNRRTEYAAVFLSGLTIFAVPTALCTLICAGVLLAAGLCSATVAGNLLTTCFVSALVYLAGYTTCALAVVMTGRPFVAVLGTAVFLGYAPVLLTYLVPAYTSIFFKTCSSGDLMYKILAVTKYFSAASLAGGLASDSASLWLWSSKWNYVAAAAVLTLALGALGYLLYLRRPAEAAGRAMTFEKANAPIRFLIVVPLALYAGFLLYEIALTGSLIWLFVGIVLGAFTVHAVIECIYQSDVAGIFSHPKQLAASVVLCLLFAGVFGTDLFGYDRWMPTEGEVASIDLTIDANYGTTDINTYWGQTPDGLSGEALKPAMELIELSLGQSDTAANAASSADDTDADSILLTVTWHLENGKTSERQYTIDPWRSEKQKDLLNQIFASEDYKNDVYSLYTADREKIQKLDWDNSIAFDTLKLSAQEQDEFIDLYLSELTSQSWSDLLECAPCCEFTVSHTKSYLPYLNGTGEDGSEDICYIYPTFTKTLAFLREKGYSPNPLSDYTFCRMTVRALDDETPATYTISDPDVYHSVKDRLCLSTIFVDTIGVSYNLDYELEIVVKTPQGTEETVTAYAPDDVLETLIESTQDTQ